MKRFPFGFPKAFLKLFLVNSIFFEKVLISADLAAYYAASFLGASPPLSPGAFSSFLQRDVLFSRLIDFFL